MEQKDYWILGIISIMVVIGIILIIVGTQKPSTSSLMLACPGVYTLGGSVGFSISTDEQAFDILKEGRTYDTRGNTFWVEDQIPSDMTASEALQEGLLKSNQNIELESGETVNDVWMLYKDKAIDRNGNLYFCRYR